MKTNIIKQALYEMRRQPVAASVTLIGTAFAIFLMMTVMMINSSTTLPIPPESNRPLILYGMNFHVQGLDESNDWGGSSAALSHATAERIYRGLEGIDTIGMFTRDNDRVDAKQTGRPQVMLYLRRTDEGFWAVFDHKLLAGRTYDRAAVDAVADVAVLTESAARAITGSDPENAVGQTINVSHKPVTVIGVVADHSTLASHAFGEIFMPISDDTWDSEGIFGPLVVAMLRNPSASEEDIRRQVIERYEKYNAELEASGKKAIYHEQPYTPRMASMPMGSNSTPSTEETDRKNLILILILLIVPAINISAMTQSRLSRRMAETGVKRAYGATRSRIFGEILAENLVITLIGGAIGLVLSLIAARLLSATIFTDVLAGNSGVSVPWQMLFNWRIFAMALGGCFVLNILSAAIPAWIAARRAPVDSLRA